MADYPYNTARWQRLRTRHLSLHPLCQDCGKQGLVTLARAVDHIHAISDGGEPFPDHTGLRALCFPCHSRKTARGPEAGAVRSDKPMKGCDVNGMPLDPNHPWNLDR